MSYADDYDRIPAPRRRCENCCRGTMYDKQLSPTVRQTWRDVYVCSLDGGNKDYRVTCGEWVSRTPNVPALKPNHGGANERDAS